MYHTILKKRPAYKSKYNNEHENQVILLMITGKKMALTCCKTFACIA